MTQEIKPLERGTAVQFAGFTAQDGTEFARVPKTYVWAWLAFQDGLRYIIEHPQGFDKKEFMNPQLGPEVVKYLDANLIAGKKYLFTPQEDIRPLTDPNPSNSSNPSNHTSDLPDLSDVT